MKQTNGTTRIRQDLAILALLTSLVIGIVPGATRVEAQTIYVANTNENVVTAIDRAKNTVETFPVGAAPAQVAITQDGTHVYVSNTGSNSVSEIDTVNKTVTEITVGGQPSGIAVTPGGDWVYVVNGLGFVEVINTHTKAIEARVAVGGTGGDIAITPNGTRAYVASEKVAVIDTGTNTLIAPPFVPETVQEPDVFNFAVAVKISPDGSHAYVSVNTYYFDFQGFSAGGGIAVIETTGNTVQRLIPLGSLPGSIAFTRDGSRLYAGIEAFWADTGYGAAFFPGRIVVAIDTVTNTTIAWTDLGADGALWNLQNTPAGLAVTPDRTSVYVAVPRLNSLVAIDTATNDVKAERIAVAAGPSGLAIVPDPSASARPYLIDAVDDSLAAPVPALSAGPALANVLANDRIGGAPAAIGNVTVSTVSSTSVGVTLNAADGSVWVAADTELGSHTLTYQICEAGDPTNCDTAAVTLTVRSSVVIDAVDDRATSHPGATALANVVSNDRLDNAPAGPGSVALSVLSSTDTGLSLLADGSVFAAAGAALGDHELLYRICEIASPTNCDTATVTVTVVPYVILAGNDSATIARTGGTAVANVLANDTFDGRTATTTSVTLSLISSTAAGLTLDAATGSVSVAGGTAVGEQLLVYRICEKARADNCSDATVTVTVNPYVVNAVADSARASSKKGGTALASVLTNDTLGGRPATVANVTLSLVSITPANTKIRLDLSDGSVDVLDKAGSGLYTLLYQICEIGAATNCARAKVSLDLSGR